MSKITELMLSFGYEERYETEDADSYWVMDEINAWLVMQGHGTFSPHVEVIRRSEKAFTKPVYIGAFNYLDLAAFLAFLPTLSWQEPAHVQLFVKEQYTDDDRFVVLEPCRIMLRTAQAMISHCEAR